MTIETARIENERGITMTYSERAEIMKTVYDDMCELIKTDEAMQERLKTDEVGTIYDLLCGIFFGENDTCIYNESVNFRQFHRRYGVDVKSRIKYHKNKLLGIKTALPNNFCVGIVVHGQWNYITNALGADVELVPFPERMTYLQAKRKINKELRNNHSTLMHYVIYRIEDDGELTKVD